jgi:hypothetical protein
MTYEFYTADSDGTNAPAVRFTSEDFNDENMLQDFARYFPRGSQLCFSDIRNADGSTKVLNGILEIIGA